MCTFGCLVSSNLIYIPKTNRPAEYSETQFVLFRYRIKYISNINQLLSWFHTMALMDGPCVRCEYNLVPIISHWLLYFYYYIYFHQVGAKSVCLSRLCRVCVCPLPMRFFPRPLIGPVISWSVWDLSSLGHYGLWQAANKMSKITNSASSGPNELKIGQRCGFPAEITHKKFQLSSFNG